MKVKKHWIVLAALLLGAVSLALLSGCGGGQSDANETDPQVEAGQRIFQAKCSACHSTEKNVVLVGPSLAGISKRAGEKVEGLSAEEYIRQSVLDPAAYLNEGYQNVMPATFGQQLNEEDLNALVAYLLTIN